MCSLRNDLPWTGWMGWGTTNRGRHNMAVPASLPFADILAHTRSFQGVDRPTLEKLVAAAGTDRVEAGHTLCRAGEPFGNVVYILVAGRMRQRRTSGDESHVHLGDFLGLASYVEGTTFGSTVEAITDCILLTVAAETLQQLERDEPSLFNCLNRIIAHKLRERRFIRDINNGALVQPVRSVMTAPIASCHPEIRLREALSMMLERNIGSLVVTDRHDKLVGLLTRAALAEAVLLHGMQPDDPIAPKAYQPCQTVLRDTPLWQAQDIQQRQGVKYVVVVDHDIPIGVVSQTDILHTLIASPGVLAPQIVQVKNLEQLSTLRARIAEEAAHIRDANRRASASVRFLSETHLAIQRQVIDLTLEGIQHQGYGKPPLPFAILIMGSGGRKEMLLNPDQDNGLIIADAPESRRPMIQLWFERFSQGLNENLARVGYPLCPGDIMARNPLYRQTLSEWQHQIDVIADRATEKAARWSNIVFDFDTLYGDDTLTAALRQHVLATVQYHAQLLTRMAEDDAQGRPALGFFNQLIVTIRDTTGAFIDLKRNGLRLIADAARIFALRDGIAAQSTTHRLESLVRVGTFSEVFRASVSDAYDTLLDLILEHQIAQAHTGIPPNSLIDLKTLTEQSRARLRLAMRIIKQFQDRLQETFGMPFLF